MTDQTPTLPTEPKTAAQLLIAVMRDVGFVGKTRQTNAEGKYMFRGIDEVMNAVGPALRAAGGFIIPTLLEKTCETQPTKSGGYVNLVRVTVSFAVHGEIGDPIVGVVPGEAFDSGDKATAKAMSVAYRTFLLQAVAIPTDEPDPDETNFERGAGVENQKPIYYDLGLALNETFRSREERLGFVETALNRRLEGGIESLGAWDVEDIEAKLALYKKARIEGRPMRDARDFLERLRTEGANS